jgi:hypothetical protein
VNQLREFKNIGQAAAFFKIARINDLGSKVSEPEAGVGVQCLLTAVPSDVPRDRNKNVRTAFRRKGLRVSVKGMRGNRVVTVTEFTERMRWYRAERFQLEQKSRAAEDVEALAREMFREARKVANLEMGSAPRMFPAILNCVARQLLIADLCKVFSVEVVAGTCRITFEAMVLVIRMAMEPRRIAEFEAAKWFEEVDLWERLDRLLPAKWIQTRRNAALAHISEQNLRRPQRISIADQARSARVKKFYDSIYALSSKYAHASPWLIAESPDEIIFNECFVTHTYRYSHNVLTFIRLYFKMAGAVKG